MISWLHKLPLFKGKNKIAGLLYASKIKTARDIIIKAKHGLYYKLPNLEESVSHSIFVNGIYEQKNIQFILDNLPENGCFMDLGANIGSICIPIAKLRPDVTILAVEASPRVFSYLEFNVNLNNLNIHLINRALYFKDNETVSFYSPEVKFGKGSMSPVFTEQSETVKTITVDTIVKANHLHGVDFIKVDVEGYESVVFKGAENTLSGINSPKVLFEFAHWAENLAADTKIGDAQRQIISYGYKLFNLDNPDKTIPLDKIYTEGTHMILASKEAGR